MMIMHIQWERKNEQSNEIAATKEQVEENWNERMIKWAKELT